MRFFSLSLSRGRSLKTQFIIMSSSTNGSLNSVDDIGYCRGSRKEKLAMLESKCNPIQSKSNPNLCKDKVPSSSLKANATQWVESAGFEPGSHDSKLSLYQGQNLAKPFNKKHYFYFGRRSMK
jgi:hypothetical protein